MRRMSTNETVNDEQLPGQMTIYDFLKPKTTVTMFGKEWHLFTDEPKGITEYDDLEVLGTYRYNNEDKWSCCQAQLEKGKVVALNVPWDIPRPDWKYWRLKEKVYPIDLRGIMDDPYCSKCGYGFWDYGERSEVDCERCPVCKNKVDWSIWHKINGREDSDENT